MMEPLKDSLLTRMGLILAGVTLLALIGMVSSILIAQESQGDAAAINLAGSLRMSGYRIATLSVHNGAAVDEELDDFERRLHQLGRSAAIPEDADSARHRAWQAVLEHWNREVRGAVATAGSGAGVADVDALVDKVDHLVTLLQERTEGKLLALRLIQGVGLFLTLGLVSVAMFQLRVNVVVPLRELLVLAGEARRGNFSVRASHVGADELGVLGRAFNDMAADLSAMYGELERRVAEQTAALRTSNRSLSLLYNVARRLNEGGASDESLQGVLGEIQALAGPGSCTLELGDGGAGDLRCLSIPGVIPAQPESCPEVSVAVVDRERRFGTLRMSRPPGGEPSEEQTLTAVARQIAVCLHATEQRRKDRRLALLEERATIARELHDSLAQSLSYLKIQVARLRSMLTADGAPPPCAEVVEELRQGLNDAYHQLRELLNTFRLKMEDAPELEPALSGFIAGLGQRSPVRIALDCDLGDRVLSPTEEIHLLYIAREALHNVLQHAHARHARVTIVSEDDGAVVMRVVDDGRGLPPTPQRTHHYGLGIMAERARSLGGDLRLTRRPQGGTVVEVRFPTATARRRQDEDG